MAYIPPETKKTQALDYDVAGNVVYQGSAIAGSSKGAAVWRITKLIYINGNLTDVQYADGNINYDNIWDDRATLIYS